jgi:ADP-heptose:LPS heptosyltransferase
VGFTRQPRTVHCDLNLINLLDVQQTAIILSSAKLLISNEGLLVHLAQSLKLPAVVLYGTTKPEYCNEVSDRIEHVISPVVCQGCRHVKQAGTMILCPRQFICMDRITVDMVYDAYKRLKSRVNESGKETANDTK